MITVRPVDEHPLPTTQPAAEAFQASNPSLPADGSLSVDELHERYVDVLAENHEWRIFRVGIYGFGGWVWVWNHQLGEGFRIHDDPEDGSWEMLVDVFAEVEMDG